MHLEYILKLEHYCTENCQDETYPLWENTIDSFCLMESQSFKLPTSYWATAVNIGLFLNLPWKKIRNLRQNYSTFYWFKFHSRGIMHEVIFQCWNGWNYSKSDWNYPCYYQGKPYALYGRKRSWSRNASLPCFIFRNLCNYKFYDAFYLAIECSRCAVIKTIVNTDCSDPITRMAPRAEHVVLLRQLRSTKQYCPSNSTLFTQTIKV